MRFNARDILNHPACYHYLRQVMTGGLPFTTYVNLYGLNQRSVRVADLGCGPADILRYVSKEKSPHFYLGVDVSDRYLETARRRAARLPFESIFLKMDLSKLPDDAQVRQSLLDEFSKHRIDTVLLLGVLHHIDDWAASATIDLIYRAPSVKRLITWDVVYLPGHRLNNFLCRMDRGKHVRDEPGYDHLAASSPWRNYTKVWTRPGLRSIRYLHYVLSK